MGTELIKRKINLNKFIWSASENTQNPEIVYNIHKEYISAGADYITTNSFRSTPRAYYKYIGSNNHIKKARESFFQSVKIAKMAAKSNIKVIGSIAPLEDCYLPQLFPGRKIASAEFSQLAEWFSETDVDLIILETMNSIIEAETALIALNNTSTPVWVSFVLQDPQTLLSGDILTDVIEMIKKYKVEKILFNCSNLNTTYNLVNNIVDIIDLDWGIYPNLGLGKPSPDGIIRNYYSIESFIFVIKHALANGASVVGACCGSSPAHINEIYKIDNVKNSCLL